MPSALDGTQASAVPNLADLISARKAERGWSYQQLADRASGVISRQRWQQLGTGTRIKEFPEPATIQSISDALDVDITLVVLAVARSIGFAVRSRDSALAAMLPPGADRLTEEQRDVVLAVVRVLAAKAGATNDEEQESRTQEGSPEHSGTGGGARRPGAPMNAGQARTNADRPNRANPARNKAEALIDEDQGSQADHELAARKGETEDEIRERLGIPYE